MSAQDPSLSLKDDRAEVSKVLKGFVFKSIAPTRSSSRKRSDLNVSRGDVFNSPINS